MIENESKLSPKELAECYHDIGSKFYNKIWIETGDDIALVNAVKVSEKSLQLKRQLKPSAICIINKTLYNLGLFNFRLNNLHVALDYFMEVVRKGSDYCPDGSAENIIELAYHGIGESYMQTGDFYKALEVYESLLNGYTVSNAKDHSPVIWAYLRLAEIYIALDESGNTTLIKSNLDKAREYLKTSSFECCFFENRINQLEGNHLSDIGAYEESVKVHQEIVSHLDQKDSVNLANVYNSMGFAYVKLKNYKKAKEVLIHAISLNRNFDSPYNNLGDLYAGQNQFKNALGSYEKAIDISINTEMNLLFDQLPDTEHLEFAKNKIELLNHIVTKANAWLIYYEHDQNQDHLQHALETFTRADQLVDLIRFVSSEQESKLYWREKSNELYMKAVKVCFLLNLPKKAFYFMERNKALLLLEDLTHEDAKEIAQLPQDLAQREYLLKRKIFLSENLLYETDTDNKVIIDSLKSMINENKFVYQEFIDSLNISYPDFAKFKKNASILSYKELMSGYITEKKTVLHYILNEEDGYGLLTDFDGSTLFQLDNAAQLNKEIDTLSHLLSTGFSDPASFNTTSNTLFDKLFPKQIYPHVKGKQLIIVPDYTLQRIPYEALVVNTTGPKYLIEDVEIAYEYSMSLLDRSMGVENNTNKEFLGIAPVVFDGQGLPQLYFSKNEVENIARLFKGTIMLNGQASKANFLKDIGQHSIIHLATHADLGDGENPWIAFSDSKMHLKEIYANKNQADMVVLSACNTSAGELKRGEGIMSLARGFFYSGAKSVVSTLWPLSDESGKDILLGFYRNLDQGYPKSKALQKAKLSYLNDIQEEELKHPYYWAGFVVVGDNAAISSEPYRYWTLAGITLAVLVLFVFRTRLVKILQ